MKKILCVLASLAVLVSLVSCKDDATPSLSSSKEESDVTSISLSSEVIPEVSSNESSVEIADAPKINLTTLLEGRSSNTDIPGWDAENKIILTSHSLEVGWASGYGKGFLIDGNIGDGAFPQTYGVYASCSLADDTVSLADVNKTSAVSEFIQINLQEKYNISKVSLYTILRSMHGFPKAFTIEISEDGTNWTEVCKEENYYTDDFNAEQPFKFSPVSGQYIRINVSKVAQEYDQNLKYSVMLGEIEVYGEKTE